MTATIWVAIALVSIANAATEQTGKPKLRELAGLPAITTEIGYFTGGLNGFATVDNQTDYTNEIPALLKAMDGGFDDAERYHRLGLMYREQDTDHKRADEALAKAVALYRKRVEAQPENGRLLADFGRVLYDSEADRAEVEHVLRRAVQLAPDDWHTWDVLGSFLSERVPFLLYNNEDAKDWSVKSFIKLATLGKPTALQMEAAQKAMKEAMDCFDKEVTLAPDNPEVWHNRALNRGEAAMFQTLLKVARGEETDFSKLTVAWFGRDGLRDFKQWAKLDPRNYRALAVVILGEFMSAAAESPRNFQAGEEPLKSLPEESRASVLEDLAALRKLETDPDKKVAAGALEFEGAFQLMYLHDQNGAEKTLRNSLALDPSREKAAQVLVLLLGTAENHGDMLTISEKLVEYHESPDNVRILAMVQARLGNFDKAEQQMERAVKLAPDDFGANLGLAAMLLKHTDDESLLRAADYIRKARPALDQMPEGDDKTQREVEYLFTAGLYQGLIGNNDSAREAFNHVLERDPQNDKAHEALKALE